MMVRTAKSRVGLLLCLAALAWSCSSRAAKPTTPPSISDVPTGAEFWNDGAMLLPQDAPAVLEVRLDQLLAVTQRLKAWLIADPMMFGAEGPQIVRTVETGWAAATAYLGVDPLSPRAWKDRGLDPARPLYAAVYPVGQVGRRFVAQVDTTIREEIGTSPGKPVAGDLRTLAEAGGALPEGTNARILRAVEEDGPVEGFRVVLPISSGKAFMVTATSFAVGMGLRAFPDAVRRREDEGSERTLYSSSDRPMAAIRLRGKHALIDVVLPSFLGPRSTLDPSEAVVESYRLLRSVLDELPTGRPSAPRPRGGPVVAATFDQVEMGRVVRLRGYRKSLQALQQSETGRRDAELLAGLLSTASEADAWSAAGDVLTGTSFELHVSVDGVGRLAQGRMTMFGRRDLPALDTHRSAPSLDVARRSVGLGIDFGLLRDPSWRKWFTGTAMDPTELDFDFVEFSNSILPGMRVATLLVSSIGDQGKSGGLSAELVAALGELQDVSRVEIVSLSPDVGDFRQPPEFLCAAVVEPGTPPAQLDALRDVLGSVLQTWYSPGQQVSLPALSLGTTATTRVGELEVHQHLLDVPRTVLLLGVGTKLSDFEDELQKLQTHQADPGAFYGRVEPLALLSWIRSEDTNILRPLQADVLAQRLGAVNLHYHASGPNSVSVELELMPPPKL